MYDIEDYYEADTVADACDLLQKHPGAILICGGSDVLIRIREGKLAGSSLISIRGIRDLHGVSMEKDGRISIGAAVTFHHLTEDPAVRQYIPVLSEAADQVGGPDPQYRHHRRKSLQRSRQRRQCTCLFLSECPAEDFRSRRRADRPHKRFLSGTGPGRFKKRRNTDPDLHRQKKLRRLYRALY